MKQAIAKLAKARGKNVVVECVDVRIGNKIDLSYATIRQKYLDAIKSKVYQAILLSPPCSTFWRACWRNFKGPRPVRNFRHRRGLQVLTAIERRKCNLGNTFADFAWEVVSLAVDIDSIVFLAFENPEDLGSINYGPHKGGRPASMWQWEQFHDLISTGKIQTFAIHQSDFGVEYPKPTRFIWKGTTDLPSCCKKGPPTFDTGGNYLGPLERAPGKMRHSAGPFLTTGTEQWPPALCSWIATHLMERQPVGGLELRHRQHRAHLIQQIRQKALQSLVDGGSRGRVRQCQVRKDSTMEVGSARQEDGRQRGDGTQVITIGASFDMTCGR